MNHKFYSKDEKQIQKTFAPFPDRFAPLLLTVSEDREELSSLVSSIGVVVVVAAGVVVVVVVVVVVEVLTLSAFCPNVSLAAP